MKVAVVSESPSDEALVRGLVDGMLGAPAEWVTLRQRTEGWPQVLHVLPSMVKHLHWRTDADGLVVVVDSDDSDVCSAGCPDPRHEHRAAQVRAVIDAAIPSKPRPGGAPQLRYAVGLAVPTIEAWALHQRDPAATEAGWQSYFTRATGRRELKRRCYGTFPTTETQRVGVMQESAARLVKDRAGLRRAFPVGFGLLEDGVTAWLR